MQVNRMFCCGWRELHGIQDYQGKFDDVLARLYITGHLEYHTGVRFGALLFTVVGRLKRQGNRFAKDIVKRELGTVAVLDKFKNPNTGHVVKSYVWFPDNKAVVKYCRENKIW